MRLINILLHLNTIYNVLRTYGAVREYLPFINVLNLCTFYVNDDNCGDDFSQNSSGYYIRVWNMEYMHEL